MRQTLSLFSCLFIAIALSGQVNLNQGLLAYYPFNGNANDATGNGNNGTPMNGVQLTTDRFGNPNSAYHFDGIDDHIIVNDNGNLSPQHVSICAMVYAEQATAQSITGKIQQTTGYHATYHIGINYDVQSGFFWGLDPGGFNCFQQIPYDPNNNPFVTSPAYFSTNVWHCVVGTFEDSVQKLYVDGVLVGTRIDSFATLDHCTNTNLLIGRWWNGDPIPFKGKIDEVRVYNRALNQTEVNLLCEVVTTPPPPAGCSVSQLAIGGNGYDRAFDVVPTTYNEFYVAGLSHSFSSSDDLLVMRVNNTGSIIWSKNIGGNGNEEVRKITPTSDGGLLLTGRTRSFSNSNGDIFCMKLSSTGNLLWSKVFGIGSANGDMGTEIIETSDGGYAVAGIINVVGFLADAVVIKLNSTGNVVWSKRFDRGDGEDGVGIIQQQGDTLIVSADLQNSGSHYEFMMMKIRSSDGGFIMAKKLLRLQEVYSIRIYSKTQLNRVTWFPVIR